MSNNFICLSECANTILSVPSYMGKRKRRSIDDSNRSIMLGKVTVELYEKVVDHAPHGWIGFIFEKYINTQS